MTTMHEQLEEAIRLLEAGHAEEARTLVQALLPEVRKARPSVELTQGLSVLAKIDLDRKDAISAAAAGRELLDALRKLADPEDRQAADWAAQHGAALERLEAFPEAEEFYERSIPLYLAAGSPKNAAAVRNNIGLLRYRTGDLVGAAGAFEEAVSAYGALGTEYSPNVATALSSLVKVYRKNGDGRGQLEALRRLAPLVAEVSPPKCPEVLQELTSAAIAVSQFDVAIDAARRRMEVAMSRFGADHANVAIAKIDLAVALRAAGREAEAEDLWRESLGTLRSTLGMSARPTRGAANNLALLLTTRGRFGEASRLFDEVLRAAKESDDSDDAELDTLLTNRANALLETGDYEGAIEGFTAALAAAKRVHGETSPALVLNLANLRTALRAGGRSEEANAILEEMAGLHANVGTQSAQFLQTLIQVSNDLLVAREYKQAMTYATLADSTVEMTIGREHPMTASLRAVMSKIALRRGILGGAIDLARQTVKILDASRPGATDLRADALSSLARALAVAGQHDEAFTRATEAEAVNDELIGQVFTTAPDRQRTEFVASVRQSFDTFLSVLMARPVDPARAAAGLALVLRRKGLGVEAFNAQREGALAERHPTLRNDLERLQKLRWETATQALAGVGTVRELADGVAQVEALEVELARSIPEMDIARRLRAVDVEAIAKCLPEGSALVEIVRAEIDALTRTKKDEPPNTTTRYLAFILHHARPAAVDFVDLGEADAIDAAVARYRLSLGAEDDARNLGAEPESPEGDDMAAALALRSMIWDPLVALVENARTIILAPDGALALVPFDALPNRDGGFIDDARTISYVLTGRDVIRFRDPQKVVTHASVVGDPDYDLGLGGVQPKSSLRTAFESFDRLAGAMAEVTEIARVLGVEPLVGAAAAKGAMRAESSPVVLHVATHGFAIAFDTSKVVDAPKTASLIDRVAGQRNPMLRSGLALAGANAFIAGSPEPSPDVGNGIITAAEIADLDLRGTQLVVLSACQTGIGDSTTGEGVYGLRRALSIAGARAQLVSLWPVADGPTRALMTAFYAALVDGAGIASALRTAKTDVRRSYPDANAWAAFICLGDPAPLSPYSKPVKGTPS